MDHILAEKSQSVVKYAMNDMSDDERTEFEGHLFDCPVCAEQVRQNFTIVENLKEVLSEEKAKSTQSEAVRSSVSGWRKWFQIPSLVPTVAALGLAGLLFYQSATDSPVARVLMPESIVAPVSRGASDGIQVQRTSPLFLVTFMVDAGRPASFVCDFLHSSGESVLTLQTPAQNTAAFNLPVLLPAKSFPAGHYQMKLHPASEPDSITTYNFVVEDSK